jgi:hypothetical protein
MSSLRYFETFFNADPMVELTEAAAKALNYYVVEDVGPMRRYRRIGYGELDSIIYASWDEPLQPLADLKHLGATVPAEIYSPVELCPHGGKRWRTWYVNEVGDVIKILELEQDADGWPVRENLRSPNGELISYTIYRYASDGLLLDLITYSPDGTEIGRQDA